MRYAIFNGEYVGTVSWSGPGHVELDVRDDDQRRWFASYFQAEDSFLSGSVGCEEISVERRDSSPAAFTRAARALAAYSYRVRDEAGAPGRGAG